MRQVSIQQYRTLHKIGENMQFTESMILIRDNFETFWRDETITIKQGWRKHRDISRQLGYSLDMIEAAERHNGVYVW